MIWVKLAKAMGFGEYFPWETCNEAIDYLLSDLGLSYDKLISQGWEEANANELSSGESPDPVSGFPNLKSLRCRVRKI
jgi:hypothetical protein